jgi:hypothetical protein
MADYENPMSMMTDPSVAMGGGQSNAFAGLLASQRQQQAAPFLQMLQQSQGLDLQKKQQDLQEYFSPTAQAARNSQRQQVIDEGDVYSRTKDSKVTMENEKAKLAPYLTGQHIEEAKKGAALARHETASLPIKYFSGAWSILEKLPEEQRPEAYDNLVKSSGFPREQLPQDLQSYQPTTMGHLAMARYSLIHTPEQAQRLEQEAVPAQAQRDVATIQTRGRLAEVQKNIDAGRFGDVDRQISRLENAIRKGVDPDSSIKLSEADKDEMKASMRRFRTAKIQDQINKDPLYKSASDAYNMAAMMAVTGDPEAQKRAKAALENAHEIRQNAYSRALKESGYSSNDLDTGSAQGPKKIKVNGTEYEDLGKDAQGKQKIRDPKTGRTGTLK